MTDDRTQPKALKLVEELNAVRVHADELETVMESASLLRSLHAENERLRAELETERMRHAACSVIAMANTRESAEKQRDMHPDYWCASVQDVARAVDREMDLRDENERLREALQYILDDLNIGAHPHLHIDLIRAALGMNE